MWQPTEAIRFPGAALSASVAAESGRRRIGNGARGPIVGGGDVESTPPFWRTMPAPFALRGIERLAQQRE